MRPAVLNTIGPALLLAALLAACATPARPPAPPAPAPAPPRGPDPLQVWLDTERVRARAAQAGGDSSAARQAWATVLALEPADTEARTGHRHAVTASGDAAIALQRRAELARSRGDIEAAMGAALQALALDPALAGAATLLRELEQQRSRRVGSFAPRPAPMAWPEEAELLLAEGDVSGALRLAEPLARAARADAPIRQRVCELLLREAERLGRSEPTAAREALQRCLRLLPRHAQAQQRLRQLR
jgi:tetratricopeptide (TPR) repeat protein